MSRKPVIGIVPLVDIQRESHWMLPGYEDGIRNAGGLPLILPLSTDPGELEQLAGMCDGILFTGGQDVDPVIYHEVRRKECGECCSERDVMEMYLLDLAISRNIPFLGICRGIQFINASLGGTLFQDLPAERPSEVDHHMTPPYDRPVHTVRIVPDTPLRDVIGAEVLPVNSYHHQAVRDLSPRLKPMAFSEDGLVEALYLPEVDFGWAVQWHPEFSFRKDASSRAIFAAFVGAASSRGCQPIN